MHLMYVDAQALICIYAHPLIWPAYFLIYVIYGINSAHLILQQLHLSVSHLIR